MGSRGGGPLARAVTTYLLNTTELRPQPSLHAVWAIINGAVIVGTEPCHSPDTQSLVMSTGSVAELYIEPLAQCFGDYDTMYHYNDMIAIPAGYPLPRRLPTEFHDDVNVYEIDDSHISGYVYLVLRYQLKRCDDGTYSWFWHEDYDDADYNYLLNSSSSRDTHGPATVEGISNLLTVISGRLDEPDSYAMSLDWVFSVRCLAWPPQAAHWPGRARPHGCPDPSSVDLVVADGCHLVPVAHRLCRDDEWMCNRQYRLSFSRAELQLINNWTPVQQLVYHVLRTVLKIADITTDCDSTVVSNYHIKTLMMWATELHPADWWNTGDSCLITAAARLLDTLASCLAQRYCQHYFVDDANLLLLTEDQSWRLSSVLTKLRSVSDVDQLATLLLDKYVRPCVLQVCPDDVVQLFYDVRNIDHALSAVAAWRCGSLREKSWRTIDSCSHGIERCVYQISLTARSYWYFVERLHNVERRLVVHFIGVACLHVAFRLATRNFYHLQHGDQLLDVLSAIFGSPSEACTWRRGSPTAITKAAILLKAIAHACYKKYSVEQLIQVELSKAYLYKELSRNSSRSVFCLANVYLAAMYYEEERYEMVVDHCKLMQATGQRDDVVRTELLPQIDDVDNVLGVCVLYQFIKAGELMRQHYELYCSGLTTHLFANTLHVFSLSRKTGNTKNLSALSEQLRRYRRSLLNCKQLLVPDILMFKLATAKLRESSDFQSSNDQEVRSIPTWNSSELVELLTQTAVERLTTFREIQTQDFGADIVPGTTDFLAMYAFRRGFYVECMRLCQNNIENFADCVVLQEIFMIPEFIFLLGDCDLVSVIGLALVISPDARQNHRCQFMFRLSQLSLALYLYAECQLRLCHSEKSLRETLLCANVASKHHPVYAVLDAWTLQLINRKITDRLNAIR